MTSVILDKDHGVNPSVTQCFYCLQDIGVALFGRLKPVQQEAFRKAGLTDGGAEAPRRVCLDQNPCAECAGFMRQGVILVSVRDGEQSKNPYRTGRFCVVRDEAIKRAVQPQELCDQILRRRFAYVSDSDWSELGLPD